MAGKKTRRGRKGRKRAPNVSFNFGANTTSKGKKRGSRGGSFGS
jgi:hypothetical protein